MHLKYTLVFLAALDFVFADPATRRRTKTISTSQPTTKTTAITAATPRRKTTSTTSQSTTTKRPRRPRTKTTSTATTTTSKAIPTPTKSSGKRGLSFNDPSLTSYFSLSGQGSKVSWAYNWASDPYYPSTWTPNSFNGVFDFVPMLWSAADDLTRIWENNVANSIAQYGANSVLSFNEPDGCCWECGNSCMNVTESAKAYKKWVQPLAGKVKLGGPAVTNGEGPGIGIDYMKQFMKACSRCTVDFIPLHWYGSVLHPESFQAYVQSFWQAFGKPVWITEFATTSGTEDEILAFLETVIPWLDQQAYVQRYAYFMVRNVGSPFLLETNNNMTRIGEMFNSS